MSPPPFSVILALSWSSLLPSAHTVIYLHCTTKLMALRPFSEERCSSVGLLCLTLRSAYRPKWHTLFLVLLYTDRPCATLKPRDHPTMKLSISAAGSSSGRRSGGFKRSVEKEVPAALALPVGGAPALPCPHPGKPFQNYEMLDGGSPGHKPGTDPLWVRSVPGSGLRAFCGVRPRIQAGGALWGRSPGAARASRARRPGARLCCAPSETAAGPWVRTRPTRRLRCWWPDPPDSRRFPTPCRSPSRSGTAALT